MAIVHQIAGQTSGFARDVPSPKTTDMSSLVEAAVRVNHRDLGSQSVTLTRDLPKGIDAEVKSSEILQALSNLIGNALDALPEGNDLAAA